MVVSNSQRVPFLTGKRILVTGGSRGLGQAFCETFARLCARVAFTYCNDERGAAKTLESMGQTEQGDANNLSYKISVLDSPGMKEVFKSLEFAWGGLDVLVNNAGVSQPIPLALMEESDWDELMNTNLKGIYTVSRAALPLFIRQKKGLILNIGSLAGSRLIEAPVHYSASKAAARGFTESLSKEVSRYGIRVLCLAPGLLEDGVAKNLPTYKLEDFLKHVSLHRRGTLKEVAEFASFLISERNTYMNGTSVLMDGGF